ncbi:MAG: leucyl aminopeptidase family protein [Erythrobacter sp.]
MAAPALSAQELAGSGIEPGTAANTALRPIAFATAYAPGDALAIVTSSADVPASAPLSDAERAATLRLIAAREFTGKAGEVLELAIGDGTPRAMLVGVGAEPGAATDWRAAGGRIAQALAQVKHPVAIVGAEDPAALAEMAFGATLGQYRFDRYKSSRTALQAQRITLVSPQAAVAQAMWQGRQAPLAEAVMFARDLVNEPANVIYPESFVARTRAAFQGVPNVTIEVLDEAAMRRLGMGAIAGVGQGSPRGSRLMMISYKGAAGAPIALAGKGITFDSGGLSLKPNDGMWEMKGDMAGAAAVTGALLSLAKSRAPVHAVAAVALAENMPDGNAQRPGDVVRTMSGKTIEIRSTDAEGRLVLADAIEYTVRQHAPYALADIATLTGAAVRALGAEYAALFARKDAHAEAAIAAGAATGEPLWRLPLHPAYAKAIKSDIADIKNSDADPAPGASAGAHFIEYFVPADLPWVHVDMAAVDRCTSTAPICPVGARGFGVMLLDELARNWRPQ